MTVQSMDLAFVADWNDRATVVPQPLIDYRRRALALWPGLDRKRLQHAQDDPLRIARLVSRGTSQSIETVLALLLGLDRPGSSVPQPRDGGNAVVSRGTLGSQNQKMEPPPGRSR